MKHRVLAISIAVALATACSTEPTAEPEDDVVSVDGHTSTPVVEAVVNETGRREPREEILIDRSAANTPAPGPQTPPPLSEQAASRPDRDRAPAKQADETRESESLRHVAPVAGQLSQAQAAEMVMRQDFRHAREPLYREQYQHPEDNRVTRVIDQPVSTFSIDVDTGAYANARRWLSQGSLPPEDAVRVEEFINYFDYDYRAPTRRSQPFRVETEIAPSPWSENSHLFRIGIQGYEVPKHQLPAANLVFLIDVSGSMRSNDKLPLLKQALGMLTRNLSARDCISIVVYAGASGVVLNPTPGDQKTRILQALDRLEAGGSTNGAAGLKLAYQMAQSKFKTGGVNRVILATDGDFNVGQASTPELIDMIQRKRKAGIALTTLGFGSGNYNDHMLEQLADEGNGNHAYIDRLSEARKVLNDELSATLLTIASDVKIQVEFNPATVAEYRLIGYENRALNEEDFNNDRVDAGEIGAGHRVTALYELTLRESDFRRLPERRYAAGNDQLEQRSSGHADEVAHLRIRYKNPGQDRSRLIESPVLRRSVMHELTQASDDFRFAAAVAAFGQKLRGGRYLENWGWHDIRTLAQQSRGMDPFGYRGEFVQLVGLAEVLDPGQAVAGTETRD